MLLGLAFLSESQGQDLALAVLYAPYSLDGGPSELYRSVQFSIKEQLLRQNVKRFQGGLVFKAERFA